jgi:hypothetical protein
VTKLVNVETGAEVTDINLRSFLFSVEPKLEVVVTGHCIGTKSGRLVNNPQIDNCQ